MKQHQGSCQFDNILLFFLNTKFYDIKFGNVSKGPLQISQFQTWNEKTLLNLMYANFILTKFFNAHIGSSQIVVVFFQSDNNKNKKEPQHNP
jgi:hypothetical protein